ncbi:MAG TPA: thiamine phosphate synthase, partial [Geminicoccaceae bacterium]|nr:thiamine phosphate synthase [Geminicoccaceae bacterium]
RPLADVVAAAVRGGVTLVQMRDKHAGGRAMLEAARALKAVLDPHGVPLIVNDRVDVAHAAGAGCHVGQSDLPADAARAILGPDPILGVSLDHPDQLREVEESLVDYVAYGPFAATATKTDAGAPVGADGLVVVRKMTMLPLVAIGGIDSRNVAEAVRVGADGIAVVSAIMAADDPEAASRELRTLIDATKAEVEKAL